MEKQSNIMIEYAKVQYRKLKFVPLLITAILIFLIAIPYLTKDYVNTENEIPPFGDEGYIPITPHDDDSTHNMTCPHYKIGLFISSELEDFEKRELMREELFGITDNLIPCMKQDSSTFYKFLVRKKKS